MSIDIFFIFVTLVCGAMAIALGAALANRSERRRMERALEASSGQPRQKAVPRPERRPKAAVGGSRRQMAALPSPPRPFKIGLGAPRALDVAIERCPSQFAECLVEIPVHSDLTVRLSTLLHHAPTLAPIPAAAAGHNLYLMTFSPTVAQCLAAGTYELGPVAEGGFRVFAVDEDGIVGQDTFTADAALQPAGLTAALWQVLSIVVGRRHLASADKRLKRLSHEVAEIRPFLETGRWRRLSGRVASLEQLLAALHPFARSRPRSRDDVAAVRGRLESMDRESLEDLDVIRAEIVALVRDSLGTARIEFLGPDRDVSAAGQRVEQFAVPLRHRNLVFLTRGVAAQLLACLPGCQDLAQRWVGQIADDAVRESRLADPGDTILQRIDKRIEHEARAKLNLEDHERLRARVDVTRRSLSEQRGALHEALEDIHDVLEAQLQEQNLAMMLVARLDRSGRVRQLYIPA